MTDILRERNALAHQGLEIITRERVGAIQSYTSARTVEEPARWFFLHITVTPDPADNFTAEAAAWRQVEAIGQSRFGIGFSYNAGTMQSGRLYEGQPLTRRGAHTVNDKDISGFPKSLNYAGRACALVQNVDDAVTEPQIDVAARWAAAQIRSGLARRDARWYGHRDFAWKSCPGDKGYAQLGDLRKLTEHYVNNGLRPPEDDVGTVEGFTGPAQETFKDLVTAAVKAENMKTGGKAGIRVAASAGAADAVRGERADGEPMPTDQLALKNRLDELEAKIDRLLAR